MPTPPAAASSRASPPRTRSGTGSPLLSPLSATGGDAIVETLTVESGRLVSLFEEALGAESLGAAPAATSDFEIPLPTCFGTLLLPCEREIAACMAARMSSVRLE